MVASARKNRQNKPWVRILLHLRFFLVWPKKTQAPRPERISGPDAKKSSPRIRTDLNFLLMCVKFWTFLPKHNFDEKDCWQLERPNPFHRFPCLPTSLGDFDGYSK